MSRIQYKTIENNSVGKKFKNKYDIFREAFPEYSMKRRFDYNKLLRRHPVCYRIDTELIEFFITYFYCEKLKLIIESDGIIHNDGPEYSHERDLRLSCKWISVLRFKNEDMQDLSSVRAIV